MGPTRMGRNHFRLEGSEDEVPGGPELLGSIPTPGPVDPYQGTPPWETDTAHSATDARRYVDVPDDWSLRWLSLRQIEQSGMREWTAVLTSDPKVKLKVPFVRHVDNTIRLGGRMLLCWRPKTWQESYRRHLDRLSAEQRQAAIDRFTSTQEKFRRGSYGPYIHGAEGHHPTHTRGDGATFERD